MIKRPAMVVAIAFVLGEVCERILGIAGIIASIVGMSVLGILWIHYAGIPFCLKQKILCFSLIGSYILGGMNGIRCLYRDTYFPVLEDKAVCQFEGEIVQAEPCMDGYYIYLNTERMRINNIEYQLDCKIQVKVKNIEELKIGNQLLISGEGRSPSYNTNPGQFDAKTYYSARNIQYTVVCDTYIVLDNRVLRIFDFLMNLRRLCSDIIHKSMPEREASILCGILLGESKCIDAEVKELYQKNGIAHILAISGLHIGLLGMGLFRILRRFGLSYLTSGIPAIVFVIAYGTMVGMGGATIRALIMLCVSIIGQMIGRTYDIMTAISLSCICMLLDNPYRLTDSAFLLSFGAMIAIGVLVPLLTINEKKKEKKRRKNIKSYLLSMLRTSICIQLVTAPIVIYFYYSLPMYSVLLNLFVIPCMTILFLVGIFGMIFGMFHLFLGKIILLPCVGILKVFQLVGKFIQELPCATWYIGSLSTAAIISYYLALITIIMLVRYHKWFGLIVLAIAILISYYTYPRGLKIVVLDVGQGDSTLIQSKHGQVILIDGGSSSSSLLGKYTLVPALHYYGTNRIDTIFISHMDTDHISGILEILETSNQPNGVYIRQIVMSASTNDFEKYTKISQLARQHNIALYEMKEEDVYKIDNISFRCLAPNDTRLLETGKSENDNSMVLELEYETFRMLFMGDLEANGEKLLLERMDIHPCDVLKVGHHGSSGSSTQDFLEVITPDHAVISCGRNNRYGHPHKETISRIRTKVSQKEIYITADRGAIIVSVKEGKYEISPFLD